MNGGEVWTLVGAWEGVPMGRENVGKAAATLLCVVHGAWVGFRFLGCPQVEPPGHKTAPVRGVPRELAV